MTCAPRQRASWTAKLPTLETVVRDLDVVLDTVGGTIRERSWTVLRRNGLLVTIVRPPPPGWVADRAARGVSFTVEPHRTQLNELSRLAG